MTERLKFNEYSICHDLQVFEARANDLCDVGAVTQSEEYWAAMDKFYDLREFSVAIQDYNDALDIIETHGQWYKEV